jgi:hypothetical protein
MGLRSSRQKIVIGYFVFPGGCLATERWKKKKQRRTRAAQQREFRTLLQIRWSKSPLKFPSSTPMSPPAYVEHAHRHLLKITMICYWTYFWSLRGTQAIPNAAPTAIRKSDRYFDRV